MNNPLKKKIFENGIETAILTHNDEIAKYISGEKNIPDAEYFARMADSLNTSIKTIIANFQMSQS